MKYKWWIAGGLIAAMVALCGLSIFSLWAATLWAGDGLRFSAFRFDTVSAEARAEQRLAVSAPAKLIVDSEGGNITRVRVGGQSVLVGRGELVF